MTPALWSLILVLFALGLGLNIAGLLGWVERKQSAVMQDRIGANRASIFGLTMLGLFHPLADLLKAVTKEDFEPPFVLRPWHMLAPAVSLAFSLATLAALPYGESIAFGGHVWRLQPLPIPAGIVFVLAMLSVGVHGVVMAGYASGSNYALLGGLRGASQMISYEVSMLTTLAAVLFIYGSLDLAEAVRWQASHVWGILVQPLGFLLFLTAGAAETKRTPFDVPEGESEIVGYFIEYSGMKFVMFLMTDFIETIVLAGLCTALYLGGWHLPGVFQVLAQPWAGIVQVAVFFLKMCAVIFLLMQIRWTLPRFRFDQLLHLGWKNLLPLSLVNVFVTFWAVYLLS